MRTHMTENEIDLASELDELAIVKASSLGAQFAKFSDLVIDTARLLVCELAFEQYLSFATRFHTGNSNTLRKLLDAFWLSLTLKSPFQDSNYVKNHLDEAEIQEGDWDDPSAGDAAAALCIIEACLREANTSEDRVLALEDGIGVSLKNEIKKQIDECIKSGGAISDLSGSIESGSVLLQVETALISVLQKAEKFNDVPEKFVNFIHGSINQHKANAEP